MQAAEQFATVAEYNARIDELAAKREQSSGSAKGQLTKVIKGLEQSRDELYAKQCADETEENAQVMVREPEDEPNQVSGEMYFEGEPEPEQQPEVTVDETNDEVADMARKQLAAELREQGAPAIAEIVEAGEKVKLAELEEAVAQTLNGIWNDGGLEGGPGESDVASLGDYVVGSGLLAYYSAAKFGHGEWASKAVVKRVTKRFDELHAQPEAATEQQPEGEPVAA